MLKALRRIGWSRDGTFSIAGPPLTGATTGELAFDGSDPIAAASVDDAEVVGVLDQGSSTVRAAPVRSSPELGVGVLDGLVVREQNNPAPEVSNAW